MGPYYADAGPDDGILMHRDVTASIEVFEAPDRSIPIGMARCIGWDAAGSAVWKLVVQDDELDGPWVIVDREFVSTRPDWRNLYRHESDHDLSRPGWAPPQWRSRTRTLRRARTGVRPSLP
jgi:hypothetical protein